MTSCLLAIAYLALAMFGHAWHDHQHCHAAACHDTACLSLAASDAPAVDACGCGCDCVSPADDDAAAVARATHAAHDGEHHCLACEALNHLKVGYSVPPTIDQATTLSSFTIDLYEAARIDAWPLVNGPRGPPVLS